MSRQTAHWKRHCLPSTVWSRPRCRGQFGTRLVARVSGTSSLPQWLLRRLLSVLIMWALWCQVAAAFKQWLPRCSGPPPSHVRFCLLTPRWSHTCVPGAVTSGGRRGRSSCCLLVWRLLSARALGSSQLDSCSPLPKRILFPSSSSVWPRSHSSFLRTWCSGGHQESNAGRRTGALSETQDELAEALTSPQSADGPQQVYGVEVLSSPACRCAQRGVWERRLHPRRTRTDSVHSLRVSPDPQGH